MYLQTQNKMTAADMIDVSIMRTSFTIFPPSFEWLPVIFSVEDLVWLKNKITLHLILSLLQKNVGITGCTT